MADFKKLLKKTIEKREQATPSFRRFIYKEAKENLQKILEANNCSAEEIEEKIHELEKAAIEIEAEFTTRQKASIISLKNSTTKKVNLKALNLSTISVREEDGKDRAKLNPQREKIFKLFTAAQNRSKLQSAAKLRRIITYSSLAAILFILLSLYSGWRFFAHRNRPMLKKTPINTEITKTIEVKKFEGRLVSKTKTAPPTSIVEPKITGPYDIANYKDKATGVEKPALLSWDLIKRGTANKDNSIIIARINAAEDNIQLRFSLKHNDNKLYKGSYYIEVIYNAIADNIALQLLNSDKKPPIELKGLNYYHPQPHQFIYSFDNKDNNLVLLSQAAGFQLNITPTDNKKSSSISFTKLKNGKEIFDNILKEWR